MLPTTRVVQTKQNFRWAAPVVEFQNSELGRSDALQNGQVRLQVLRCGAVPQYNLRMELAPVCRALSAQSAV
jgi:hypothetical protein